MRFKGEYCENETTYVPKGHNPVGRRRTWRAATRAAEQAEGKEGRDRERKIRCNESTLHSVLHLPPKHQCDCHSNCNNRRSSSCSNRSNALAMTDTLATVVEETTAGGVESY